MFYAHDQNHNRIHIDSAEKGNTYFCPSCGSPLIQKHGDIRIHHYAHAKDYPCSDNWNYDGMSEWHIGWQERYPEECREVVMEKDGVKHRADICINNTVVEFQHSPISLEEFNERNQFYTSGGYRVIWLFDVREQYGTTLFQSEKPFHYEWKYAPQTLTDFDFSDAVQIYVHLIGKANDGIGKIVRVCEGNFKYFKTYNKTIYDEEQFLKLTISGIEQEELPLQDFCHTLYSVRKRNNEVEYFGCPLNDDGYAPKTREVNRLSCDQCFYCQSYNNQSVKCAGRFNILLDDFGCMLEKSSSSHIWNLVYLNKEGRIRRLKVMPPTAPGKSLPELWEEYDPEKMGVINVETGRKFKIVSSPADMMEKYKNRVYGYAWDPWWNRYQKNWEIYYASNHVWIVEWFRKKQG